MDREVSGDECYLPVNVDILMETARAVHVRCSDNVRRWIPRSVIFGPDEKRISAMVGQMMSLKVMEWFINKNSIPRAKKS